jgi:hypothetical protein
MPVLAGEGTYTSGKGAVVTFTPDATGVQITGINNTGWDSEESNRKCEVTNAQSGNHTKWIPSCDDTSGAFEVVFNTSATPESVGLKKGALGTLLQYLGNSGRTKSQYVLIEKVAFKLVCNGGTAIKYTVNWQGNGDVTNA